MDINKKRHIAVFLIFVALLVIYFYQPYLDQTKPFVASFLGSFLLVYAYATGVFAIVVGLGMSMFYFLVSLPFIAPVYAVVVGYSVYLYNKIFGYAITKLLQMFPPLQRLVNKVQADERYLRVQDFVLGVLAKLGLRKVKHMQLFEVVRCPHCNQLIPVESRACLYCKKDVVLE